MGQAITAWLVLLEEHIQRGTGRAEFMVEGRNFEWSADELLIALSGAISKDWAVSRTTLDSWRRGTTFPQRERQRALFIAFWPKGRRSNPVGFDKFRDALAAAKAEHKFTKPDRPVSSTIHEIPNALAKELASLGVAITDFVASDVHPPAMNEAIERYTRQWQDLSAVTHSDDVLVPISNYPSVFSVAYHPRHAEYYDFLRDIGLRYPQIGLIRSRNQEYPGALLQDANLPFRRKVIFASTFFYQSDSRRSSWCLIPVGAQRAFGAVVPRTLFEREMASLTRTEPLSVCADCDDEMADALTRLGERYFGADAMAGSRWHPDLSRAFLRRLIRRLTDLDGRIYIRRGYVQADLLHQFLSRDPLRGATSAHDLIEVSGAREESGFEVFDTDRLDPPVSGKNVCALFDLGQSDRVQEGLRRVKAHSGANDFVVVFIRHDLDIPVGIAFSPPLTPMLFKRDQWRANRPPELLYESMRRAAIDIYVDPGREADFLSIGIDLQVRPGDVR